MSHQCWHSVLSGLVIASLLVGCDQSTSRSDETVPPQIPTDPIEITDPSLPPETEVEVGSLTTVHSVEIIEDIDSVYDLPDCDAETRDGAYFIKQGQDDKDGTSRFYYCSLAEDGGYDFASLYLDRTFFDWDVLTQKAGFITILDDRDQLVDVVAVEVSTIDHVNPYHLRCRGLRYGSSTFSSYEAKAGEICTGLVDYTGDVEESLPGQLLFNGNYEDAVVEYAAPNGKKLELRMFDIIQLRAVNESNHSD